MQKKYKQNSVFFVLCSRENSAKFPYEFSSKRSRISLSQTKFRRYLGEISHQLKRNFGIAKIPSSENSHPRNFARAKIRIGDISTKRNFAGNGSGL